MWLGGTLCLTVSNNLHLTSSTVHINIRILLYLHLNPLRLCLPLNHPIKMVLPSSSTLRLGNIWNYKSSRATSHPAPNSRHLKNFKHFMKKRSDIALLVPKNYLRFNPFPLNISSINILILKFSHYVAPIYIDYTSHMTSYDLTPYSLSSQFHPRSPTPSIPNSGNPVSFKKPAAKFAVNAKLKV